MSDPIANPPSSKPTTIETTGSYQPLIDRIWKIAHTMQKLVDERSILLIFKNGGPMTAAERARLGDLNSSLDTFDSYLEDLGEIPSKPWIERANVA